MTPDRGRWRVDGTPRAWQAEALQRWNERRRGVVSVVTGGGKTRFALECMSSAAASGTDRFLVVAPTVALQDQWVVELQETLGVPPDDIGTVGGGRGRPDLSRKVLVSTMASGRSLDVSVWPAGWMLVIDECHRVASEANRRILEAANGPTLGLSATPVREYDDWFQEYVVPAIGPVIFEYGYTEALQDGVITPFNLHHYRVPLRETEQADIDKVERRLRMALRRQNDSDEEQIKRLLMQRARISQSARSRLATTVAILDQNKGQRALVFHESVAAADGIATRLRKGGHSAESYHSAQQPLTRYRNLLLFRRRQLDVLVTCRALDEGIDIPDVALGIIAASTSSTRQRIQRLGRVVRRSAGKDAALICSLYALDSERTRLEAEELRLLGLADVSWFRAER